MASPKCKQPYKRRLIGKAATVIRVAGMLLQRDCDSETLCNEVDTNTL